MQPRRKGRRCAAAAGGGMRGCARPPARARGWPVVGGSGRLIDTISIEMHVRTYVAGVQVVAGLVLPCAVDPGRGHAERLGCRGWDPVFWIGLEVVGSWLCFF